MNFVHKGSISLYAPASDARVAQKMVTNKVYRA